MVVIEHVGVAQESSRPSSKRRDFDLRLRGVWKLIHRQRINVAAQGSVESKHEDLDRVFALLAALATDEHGDQRPQSQDAVVVLPLPAAPRMISIPGRFRDTIASCSGVGLTIARGRIQILKLLILVPRRFTSPQDRTPGLQAWGARDSL